MKSNIPKYKYSAVIVDSILDEYLTQKSQMNIISSIKFFFIHDPRFVGYKLSTQLQRKIKRYANLTGKNDSVEFIKTFTDHEFINSLLKTYEKDPLSFIVNLLKQHQ